MWPLAIEILKALFAGDFLRYYHEHLAKKADHVAEKDMADSDAVAQQQLRDKWIR